jgi:triphosphoribosyl-dephospho-CoA synthase
MNTMRRDPAGALVRQLSSHPLPPACVQALGRAAVAALYDELALDPKPGLVSFVDTGSHHDMDARTFMRSLFSLRRYFPQLVALGAAGAPFAALQQAGIAAEARMLQATGGINTHRGAIFCLGLLCAGAGALQAGGARLTPAALRAAVLARWGEALAERAQRCGSGQATSKGGSAARRWGLRSAGAEAADGFPTLFETTVPALVQALHQGATPRQARVQALFATIAMLDDTNLAHRGGLAGLRHAQAAARVYLAAGGALAPHGLAHAQAIHADFVARHLSPGGAADMLGAACWVLRVGEMT